MVDFESIGAKRLDKNNLNAYPEFYDLHGVKFNYSFINNMHYVYITPECKDHSIYFLDYYDRDEFKDVNKFYCVNDIDLNEFNEVCKIISKGQINLNKELNRSKLNISLFNKELEEEKKFINKEYSNFKKAYNKSSLDSEGLDLYNEEENYYLNALNSIFVINKLNNDMLRNKINFFTAFGYIVVNMKEKNKFQSRRDQIN